MNVSLIKNSRGASTWEPVVKNLCGLCVSARPEGLGPPHKFTNYCLA